MKVKNFKKGELICQEESLGGEMYVIISGKALVYKMIDGNRINLATEEFIKLLEDVAAQRNSLIRKK